MAMFLLGQASPFPFQSKQQIILQSRPILTSKSMQNPRTLNLKNTLSDFSSQSLKFVLSGALALGISMSGINLCCFGLIFIIMNHQTIFSAKDVILRFL